jgi:hypothetical protein
MTSPELQSTLVLKQFVDVFRARGPNSQEKSSHSIDRPLKRSCSSGGGVSGSVDELRLTRRVVSSGLPCSICRQTSRHLGVDPGVDRCFGALLASSKQIYGPSRKLGLG